MSDTTIYLFRDRGQVWVPPMVEEFRGDEELAQTMAEEYPSFIYFFALDPEPENPLSCRFCGGFGVLHRADCPNQDKQEVWVEPETCTAPVAVDKTEIRSVSSTGAEKGVKLQRFDLIPIGPLTALAEHYGRGAKKYADHNWRKGYEWGKSYSALMRHLTQFWSGEDYDVCPEVNGRYGGPGCLELKPGTNESAIGHVPQGRTCYNHTGSHHMVAVVWNAFTLLEYKDVFPEFDDRYIQSRIEAERAKLIEDLKVKLSGAGPSVAIQHELSN